MAHTACSASRLLLELHSNFEFFLLPMTFHIITIFPKIFDSYFSESIVSRAQKSGKIKIKIHNLRDFAMDKHRTVDDTPYGGGAGW